MCYNRNEKKEQKNKTLEKLDDEITKRIREIDG